MNPTIVSIPAPEVISNASEAPVVTLNVSSFDPEKTFVLLTKSLIVNFPVWVVAEITSSPFPVNVEITKSFAPPTTIVLVAVCVVKSSIVTALPSLSALPAVSKTVSTLSPVVIAVWFLFTSSNSVPFAKSPSALSMFNEAVTFSAKTSLLFSFTLIEPVAAETKTSLTWALVKSVSVPPSNAIVDFVALEVTSTSSNAAPTPFRVTAPPVNSTVFAKV